MEFNISNTTITDYYQIEKDQLINIQKLIELHDKSLQWDKWIIMCEEVNFSNTLVGSFNDIRSSFQFMKTEMDKWAAHVKKVLGKQNLNQTDYSLHCSQICNTDLNEAYSPLGIWKKKHINRTDYRILFSLVDSNDLLGIYNN